MTERRCVVLAGGLGTRIRSVTKDLVPKVLIEVNGRPFLEYKLQSLRTMGFDSVDLLVSHKGEQVVDYIMSSKIKDLSVRVIFDSVTEQGTAGSIMEHIADLPESFWVTYGDSYLIAPVDEVELSYPDQSVCVMVVVEADSTTESGNVAIDSETNQILNYQKSSPGVILPYLDFGILRLNQSAFGGFQRGVTCDLSKVFMKLINEQKLFGFVTSENYWDIGTPSRLAATQEFLAKCGDGESL